MIEGYITVTRLAKKTGLSEQVIGRMLRRAEIKGIKVSRDWLIPADETERLEAQYPLEDLRRE